MEKSIRKSDSLECATVYTQVINAIFDHLCIYRSSNEAVGHDTNQGLPFTGYQLYAGSVGASCPHYRSWGNASLTID